LEIAYENAIAASSSDATLREAYFAYAVGSATAQSAASRSLVKVNGFAPIRSPFFRIHDRLRITVLWPF